MVNKMTDAPLYERECRQCEVGLPHSICDSQGEMKLINVPQWKKLDMEKDCDIILDSIFFENINDKFQQCLIPKSLLAQVQKEAEEKGRYLERLEQMEKAVNKAKKENSAREDLK